MPTATPPCCTDDRIDHVVADIASGALSRGVVNKVRRERLEKWSAFARNARNRWKATGDPRWARFDGGLTVTPVLLAGHNVDDHPGGDWVHPAVQT